ncbi:hypothetical protein O3Q52_01475 [Streptomyces sp. ActVer]|uniref:hypothetical protein n=1 Tax=Streptomyces sp. ActVer TaxID=3014558 RepID=UPI0022B3D229|nr:hypothetical protein [Streptomyces sp. ActVer]MCZ4506898.1 hypothetical protein [Streptomyces sp. ActVer]
MTDLIHRLATWVGLLLIPRGAHRGRPAHPAPATSPPPRAVVPPLPAHRSPYGLDTPLDATATQPVRPYLTAHEQWWRRRELALATLGLDTPGPYWIHGVEVA